MDHCHGTRHSLPRGCHHLKDSRAVRRALDSGSRVAVVGCGFIGSEVASAARSRGLPATIVEAAPAPFVNTLGHEYRSRLQFVGIQGVDEQACVLDDLGNGEPDGRRLVVLNRSGDRLVGAFALNATAELPRYRRLITKRAPWVEALASAPADG